MSRKFDFGNDRDKTVCCIFYHILDLFLRIETAIFRSFAIDTFGTDLCQFRIFFDFDTPTLIVRQMPVHAVDLEQGQYIEVFLYVLYRDEMTARIQHDTTIFETRFVFHRYAGSSPGNTVHNCRTFNFGRKQLHECLHTIEQALRGFSLDRHALRSDIQRVALVVYIQCPVDCQRNAVGGSLVTDCYPIAGGKIHLGGKIFGYCFSFRSGSGESCVFA